MNKYVSILCLALLFTSCGASEVIDSWKSDNFQNIKGNKILVIAKTPDPIVQKTYEKAIVSKLQGQHIDAIGMHRIFPDIEDKEQRTTEEVEQILRMFKDKKIEGLLITSLKQTIETNSSSKPERGKIQIENKRKGSFTIEAYDNLTDLPDLDKLDFDTSKGSKNIAITYILESITYDLTLEKDQQLVNVCLLDVVDPDAADQVLNAFVKMISDQFKK
ncbi:hypothetical protein [Aquimarina mytili]|uniref:Lipoprotein n=1 Tax=Aquimarina mytili TaxID=874423 RepID=A0A936ZQB2_9FLAO|nr:hypothetical protein [Aquimarina mytili]MBL0682342.1 hypothetical protein [Aquimarina mytili]